MIRINFIVEGPTEEVFVKRVLTPYLSARGVYPSVRAVETSRHGDRIYRGGMTNYLKAKNDICRWLKQEKEAYLTTMFDFYALPSDFPGYEKAISIDDPYISVALIEKRFYENINNERLIPYIQLHEFEALLFSDTNIIDGWMELFGQHGRTKQLNKILTTYNNSAEHINHGPDTAPSKRLESIYSAYDKVFMGSSVAEDIGMELMMEKCPHFAAWISNLVDLAS